jgi:tetratricopeptide (TPR) repeat protein
VLATRRGYDFHLEEALAAGRRAVEVARVVGAAEQESRAHQALGWALIQSGRADEGVEESRRGVEVAAGTGRDYDEIMAAATYAFHLFVAGRPQEGMAVAAAAAERASGLGLRWTASFCVNQRVEALLWSGRFDEAEIALREMIELERGLANAGSSGTSRMFDGLLRLWRGDTDGAVASLEAVASTKNRLDDFSSGWESAGWLAIAYARQGRADALDLGRRVAHAVADRSGAYPTAFAATVLLASRWFLESDDDETLQLGLESLRLAEATTSPSPGTEAAGFLAEARAWAATASGASDPGLWDDAV